MMTICDSPRRGPRLAAAAAVLLALSCAAGLHGQEPDGPDAVTVYLTEQEAIREAFPEADSVWAQTWHPTQDARLALSRRLGWRLADSTFTILHGLKDGRPAGSAMIDEEVGLYHPITFIVKVGPDGRVERVRVMVYRESRGGEVRRRRFMDQYEGKSAGSSIRINRDIIGITGATLSVRALNAGVKKVLAIVEAARESGSTR